MLKFEYVDAANIQRCLENTPAYSGIVCTSARAVQALSEQNISIEASWKEKPVYTVGPATRHALESLGISTLGEASGNAESLAHYILQNHSQTRLPLLFLCGSSRRDELPDILTSGGIGIEECIVYHTHSVDPIDLDTLSQPDVAVFFSPSGVHAVWKHWPAEWTQVDCVSIGSRTTNALHDVGFRATATALQPTPEGVVEAVQRSTPAS